MRGRKTPQKRAAVAQQDVAAREREAQVLQLRLAGATFPQIARELSLHDASHAHRIYKRALRNVSNLRALAEEARTEYDLQTDAELRFLLRMRRQLTKVAEAEKSRPNDIVNAVNAGTQNSAQVANVLAKRMSILGHAKPTKVAHGGDASLPPVSVRVMPLSELSELSDDQIAELGEAVRQSAQAAARAGAAAAAGPGDGAPAEGEDDGGGAGGDA